MKKIYAYFCLLFVGSFLPFIIVEFYFQEYFTVGILTLIAIVVLALCISIKYLIGKIILRLDTKDKIIDTLDWTRKKEESGKAASYYFRNRFH